MKYIKKHIDEVIVGDTILCKDDKIRTLCSKYIKSDSFMGRSIWGDCYKSGHELVTVVIF